MTSIGSSAFDGCSALKTVTFGDNSQLESIGGSAFRDCSSLTSIEIPSRVTSIASNAFEDCSSLTSIDIPRSVTSIYNSAFDGCSALKTVTFEDTETEWLVAKGYTSETITLENLKDQSIMATYLTSDYCSYTWTKKQ